MTDADELAAELEALTYTYDELERVDDAAVRLCIRPSSPDHETYVQVTLVLAVDAAAYPSQPPTIRLEGAQGMSDARVAALRARLEAEAAELRGELMLGALFHCAAEVLQDMNAPEGDCAICLDPLPGASHPAAKLPCFHAFHRPCFVAWWAWSQCQLLAQEQALEARAGASAAALLKDEQLPPKQDGFFQLGCPACRAPAPLGALSHLDRELRAAVKAAVAEAPPAPQPAAARAGSAPALPAAAPPQAEAAGQRLTAVQLAPYAAEQAARQAAFERQQAVGGIIEEKSSLLVADWVPPPPPAAPQAAAAALTQQPGGGVRQGGGSSRDGARAGAQQQGRSRGGSGRGGGRRGGGGSRGGLEGGRGRGRSSGQHPAGGHAASQQGVGRQDSQGGTRPAAPAGQEAARCNMREGPDRQHSASRGGGRSRPPGRGPAGRSGPRHAGRSPSQPQGAGAAAQHGGEGGGGGP